jgi:hypothetical protein
MSLREDATFLLADVHVSKGSQKSYGFMKEDKTGSFKLDPDVGLK